MNKNLIAYFSVSGVTARSARMLAELTGAALYEINPEVPYTADDLDWTNKESRSSVEMQDLNCRPALKEVPVLSDCETLYVGFPIWWGREPSVVDSFLDAAALNGVTLVPFCTSGASDSEAATARIAELTAGKAVVVSGKRIPADASAEDIKKLFCE